jgi:hypothetical protein
MSIGKWETDEFPQKKADCHNAIIRNVETQLVRWMQNSLKNMIAY